MCVLPVPLLPTAIMFSRRVMYSQRASSRTNILLSEGIAVKSKLSRLFTVGNRASLMRRSIDALGGALLGELVVFAQERRQLKRFEVMGEQQLRRLAHDAPASRPR